MSEMTLQIVKTILALLAVCSLAYVSLRLLALKVKVKETLESSEFKIIDRILIDSENELLIVYLSEHQKKLLLSKNRHSGIRLIAEFDKSEEVKTPIKSVA